MMKTKLLLMLFVVGLAAGAVQANMLVNPSFEDGVFSPEDPPEGWTDSYASWYSNMTWIDDAAGAHWGSKYIKMNMWATAFDTAWFWQTVDVTEGQEYTFSVWAKCPVLGETSEAWGYYEYLNSSSAVISGGWLPWGWDVGSVWEHIEFGTAMAPASATRAVYYLAGIPENSMMGVLFDDAYMGIPRPSFPSPAWEAKVAIGDVDLSWTNLDPNNPGDPVYVDVWFGSEPDEIEQLTLDPVSGQDVTSLTVEDLAEGTYYWRVDSYLYGDPAVVEYDTNDPNDPNSIKGHLWSFDVVADAPPSSVDAGADMITLSGMGVDLDATIVDDDQSALTIVWSSDTPAGTDVSFSATDIEDPTVTISNVPNPYADVVNPSFEDGLTGWDTFGAGHGTWTGVWGKTYITPTDGILVAYVDGTMGDPNEGGWLSQTLTETLKADTTYTLTVDVVNDGYYDEDVQYKVQLLAGETVIAEDNDSYPLNLGTGGKASDWETSTVIHTAGSDVVSDPNLGQPLGIRLVAKVDTIEMTFDNVHLAADPPFPAPEFSTVELTVMVNDESNPTYVVNDSMAVDVYSDACAAAKGAGLTADNPGDIDEDCDTDIDDLVAAVETWLNDTSLTEAVFASAGVGQALYERWDSAGSAESMLTESSIPDYTEIITSTEWGVGDDDALSDYRGRITAWLTPPVTGDYIFWIVTDDNGRLWLSTDHDPINAQLIASESSWAPEEGWGEVGDEAQSSPITLQGGRAYWLRGGYQEGGGGDHIRIGWASSEAGIADHTIIEGQYLSDTDPGPVNAGDDMITVSGLTVQLAPSFIDDYTPTSYLWTTDAPAGYTVEFDPGATVEAPTVTIAQDTPSNPSTVIVTLLVNGSDEDSMEIDVYNDACLATKATETIELDPTDFDGNCITDIEDYAAMALTWLVDYELTEPVEKP